MTSPNRRRFIGGALMAGAAVGANERIRLGVIGTGGRGTYLTGAFREHGAELVAVCDVYQQHLENGRRAASPGAAAHYDYRRLLDDRTIDAVIIATPDHLHARMLIDAVAAGKHVYIEKPLARTIEEGFQMIDAVRRSRRTVLVGTQRRSYGLYQEAKQLLDSRVTGDVRLVNTWWVNRWDALRARPVSGKLEWDVFLGPAPKRPFDPVRYYNWLAFWDYSGGMMIGQAAHVIDAVQWMMNSKAPVAVTAAGGRVNVAGAEIPETSSMIVEFPENYLLVFTLGYSAMRYNLHNDQLMQFHGQKARFDLGRESWSVTPQTSAIEIKPSSEKRMPNTFESASHAHVRHFLDCLRNRTEPNSTVETAQWTNIVLGMAVQSLRTGRRVEWDSSARRIRG
jgi:predicted dehydrogenase